MKAVIICGHNLNPRMLKRYSWLEKLYDLEVYVDKEKGDEFEGVISYPISELNYRDIKKVNLVYVSGVTVLKYCWYYLLLLNFVGKVKVVYEIPDLPLRKSSKFLNNVVSWLFKSMVNLTFKNVVVTSDAFKSSLPNHLNYLVCENYPSMENYNKIISLDKKSYESKEWVDIAYIGVPRYYEQLFLLLKFTELDKRVRVSIFGGPESSYQGFLDYLVSINVDINEFQRFKYFGAYSPSEIGSLYENVDFVFSAYDTNQPNVRLALPNKLYEAVLARVPIIVSSGTYLSEIVERNGIGFSIPHKINDFESVRDDIYEKLFDNYQIEERYREKMVLDLMNQEMRFLKWIQKYE